MAVVEALYMPVMPSGSRWSPPDGPAAVGASRERVRLLG